MLKWLALCALLWGAPALSAPVVGKSDAEIASFFDGQIRHQMHDLAIPGGALVVVRGDRIIFKRGYGVADLKTRRPVDVDRSLFRAASISKLLPWLAVMQLVEEGRLDLDADINRYLDFSIPQRFGRPITMRDLMTHSSGFPERFHGVFDQDLSVPLGTMLRTNVPEPLYPPGQRIAYCNYCAALAGYVVQRLRGQPWERVVQDRLFRPIGMQSSTVLQPVPANLRGRLVSTYVDGDPSPQPFRVTPLAPMGSLTPTAADMGRLVLALVNHGMGEGGRVVQPATLDKMFALNRALGPGLPDGLGLGFLVGNYHGIRYAGHAGNMSALATDLEVLPDLGLGYYYVLNSQGVGEGGRKVRENLLFAAIDQLGGGVSTPVVARGPSSARDLAGSWISSRRLGGGPLWFSGLMNTTEVRPRGDGSVDIESSGEITHWLPDGRDRFREEESGIPLGMARDASGTVVRFGSARLYPAADFNRQPAILRLVPFVAAFSFGVLLLALVVRPIAAVVRRRRARKRPNEDAAMHDSNLRKWASRAFWLLAATLGLWGIVGILAAIDFSLILRLPGVVRIALALLTMASLAWAGILCADAVQRWRADKPERWRALGQSLVATAAVGMAILLYGFDVIDPYANW